jgi:hypothetical protein
MVNLEITAKSEQPTEKDLETITAQLGRNPRDVSAVAHRCPCGQADVVTTPPRLADGTPFPTFYYATCPKLAGQVAAGVRCVPFQARVPWVCGPCWPTVTQLASVCQGSGTG